jgi:hypothetical protein
MAPDPTESWPRERNRCAAASRCTTPPLAARLRRQAAFGGRRRGQTRRSRRPWMSLIPPRAQGRNANDPGRRVRATKPRSRSKRCLRARRRRSRARIAKALAGGDCAALRYCVGLILPARRDRPVVFELPEIAGAGGLVKAARALLAACAKGIVAPAEATEVMALITAIQAIETMGERKTRLIELERQQQACTAKASREEAAPYDRRASPPARLAHRRRKRFGVSASEIEKGIPAPRRVGCKSAVFNSMTRARSAKHPRAHSACRAFCAPYKNLHDPSGHQTVREIFSGLGERGGAALTAPSWRLIRGPPTDQLEPYPTEALVGEFDENWCERDFRECSKELMRGFEFERQAARACT